MATSTPEDVRKHGQAHLDGHEHPEMRKVAARALRQQHNLVDDQLSDIQQPDRQSTAYQSQDQAARGQSPADLPDQSQERGYIAERIELLPERELFILGLTGAGPVGIVRCGIIHATDDTSGGDDWRRGLLVGASGRALHAGRGLRKYLKPGQRNFLTALRAAAVGAVFDSLKRLLQPTEFDVLTHPQILRHRLVLQFIHTRQPADRRLVELDGLEPDVGHSHAALQVLEFGFEVVAEFFEVGGGDVGGRGVGGFRH